MTRSNPALLALLRDCRTSMATALLAAECGATPGPGPGPGPGWRASARATLRIINDVLGEGTDATRRTP